MINFFKKLRVRQIMTVFLAGILLVVSTACSSGDVTGARPNNPPVQAGGANNPYKGGGDGYTNYKASTDSRVNNKRAELSINSSQLIAVNRENEILYPGAETQAGRAEKNKELPLITEEDFEQPQPGGLNQRQSDVGDRVEGRLENAQETFKGASTFLKDKGDESRSGSAMK